MPAFNQSHIHCIHLRQTLPQAFADCACTESDVWMKDVCFERGKTILIEAASGTGKSSLCSFIYGQRKDYRGAICFDDTDVNAYTMAQWIALRRHSISMLFQDLRLFPELTALENVQAKNALTRFKSNKQIEQLFHQLGIADKQHQQTDKLSFGQQQRVAFIRALCQPFDFIFLDEPISHLDDENGATFAQMLTAEVSRQGAGIVATSIGKHLPLNYDMTFRL